MEARGEIRGGRFVDGFSGEQFATPEAVDLIRKYTGREHPPLDLVVSATDPLNLVGVILPNERVIALQINKVLFRNGLPVAKQSNGEVYFIGESEKAPSRHAN